MIIVKCDSDLDKVTNPELKIVIRDSLAELISVIEVDGDKYDPEEDGYNAIIENKEDLDKVDEIGLEKDDLRFQEYVNDISTSKGEYKEFLILWNNDGGVVLYMTTELYNEMNMGELNDNN